MPGSIVTTLPASSMSVDSRERRGASWMDDADAVAEAVAEVVAVAGGRDHVARDRVGLDAGHPGPDPVDRGELRLEADVVDLPQLASAARRSRACACSRSSSRRAGRPSRRSTSVRGLDDRRRPGSPCGFEPFGPAAIAVSKREVVDAVGVQQLPEPPGELALAAADPRLRRQRLERAVGRPRRPRGSCSISSSSLTARSASTTPGRRHELEPARRRAPRPARTAARPPRTPIFPRSRFGEVEHQRALREHRLDARDRLGGLDVAEVGEQLRRALRVDEQRRVRAVEPGQVADVDEVRDEQPLARAARAAGRAARLTRSRPLREELERLAVAVGPLADHAVRGEVGDDRVAPPLLALLDVRQVHLDDRDRRGCRARRGSRSCSATTRPG